MSDLSAQVRKALDVAVEAIGGKPREGQIEMAEAVANALTDRHHLMVQAGTGTCLLNSRHRPWSQSIGGNSNLGAATSAS
jgi:hypothetical protein